MLSGGGGKGYIAVNHEGKSKPQSGPSSRAGIVFLDPAEATYAGAPDWSKTLLTGRRLLQQEIQIALIQSSGHRHSLEHVQQEVNDSKELLEEAFVHRNSVVRLLGEEVKSVDSSTHKHHCSPCEIRWNYEPTRCSLNS